MAAGPGGAGGRAEAYRDIAQSVADLFRGCLGGAAEGLGAVVDRARLRPGLCGDGREAIEGSTEPRLEWSCCHLSWQARNCILELKPHWGCLGGSEEQRGILLEAGR